MVSASAGVNPACPVAIRYIAGPKMRSSAIYASDGRVVAKECRQFCLTSCIRISDMYHTPGVHTANQHF
jgi:hypothetical protein